MKSVVKKITSALLVIPLLALGIGFFGAIPAYAANDGTCKDVNGKVSYKNCTAANGDKYDVNGVKTAADDCDETKGIGGAVNENCAKGEGQRSKLFGTDGIVTTIINVLLFVIGILCVIMIIYGGIRYTTSTGDKGRVDGDKNTIVYAVVGLVVAIVAYALVNWVFGSLQGN